MRFTFFFIVKRRAIPNKLAILVFLFMGLTFTGYSQNVLSELTVDRPGIADTPFTVPKGSYQFELGFDFFTRYTGNNYDLPIVVLRRGISKRTELRATTRHVVDRSDGQGFDVVSPASVGFKTHLIKQKKLFPELDFMGSVVVPTSRVSGQANQIGYEAQLLFQNDISKKVAINYNVGYLWDAYRGIPTFSASLCLNYLPSDRIGLFAEYFDFVPNQWPGEQGFDFGITFELDNMIQLDLSAGLSTLDTHPNHFVSTGVAFRLNPKEG